MDFTTYEEYVALFSEWQEKLLDVADKILVTGNVHLRIYLRNTLARSFVQFIEEVNATELKISQKTMTPSIDLSHTPDLRMGDTDVFEDADEETVANPENGNDFDYDEEGSVDMMFDDLNTLRDEYQDFLKLIDNTYDDDDEELLDDIALTLTTSFKTIRDAIIQRLHWNEAIADEAIGWIDRPRTNIYLQNTGRDVPVVESNAIATMVRESDYSYSILVPVRLFHEDGSYEDYNTSGRRI